MRAYKYTVAEIPTVDAFDGALKRTAVQGDSSMVVFNWLQPGHPELADHSHPFDQLAFILSGRMAMHVEKTWFELTKGDFLVIPADAIHGGHVVGDEPVLNVDVFGVVRDDFLNLVAWQQRDRVSASNTTTLKEN